MAATRLMALHINKGKTLAQCLQERTDYASNPEKTEKGELVTAYECDPMTVDEKFLLSKRQYQHITGRHQKNDVIAYQIRQSFREMICGEIDAALAKRPKDFEAFLKLFEAAGYEYKTGKHTAVRGKGQQRFVRFRSLGEGYSEREIRAVLQGEKAHKANKTVALG